MSGALTVILVIQCVLGAIWTLSLMTAAETGMEGLMLFIYIYPFHAVFFLVGLWAAWRRPDQRRKAIWIAALPFGLLFLPSLLKGILGGPVSGQQILFFLIGLAVLGVVISILRPARAIRFLPNGMFRSRAFNLFIVIGIVAGWLVPIGLFVLGGDSGRGTSQTDSTGMGAAYLLIGAALYLVVVGLASVWTMFWGWLGLMGGVEGAQRKLHVAQCVVALPGMLAGTVAVLFLLSQ